MYYMYSCVCVIHRVHLSLEFVNFLVFLETEKKFLFILLKE